MSIPMYDTCIKTCKNICKLLQEHYNPKLDYDAEYQLRLYGYCRKNIIEKIDNRKIVLTFQYQPVYAVDLEMSGEYFFRYYELLNYDDIFKRNLYKYIDMSKFMELLETIKKDAFLNKLKCSIWR